MAKITVKSMASNRLGAKPLGVEPLHFVLTTNAIGIVQNADKAAALAIGDVVNLGVLPAGFKLLDAQVVVVDAMKASTTAKLGFAYADGVDDTAVPQDDDYFGTGLVLSAAARLRNATANKAVTLPKNAHLTLTLAGAANDEASHVEVIVFGIFEGVA